MNQGKTCTGNFFIHCFVLELRFVCLKSVVIADLFLTPVRQML